MGKNGDFRFLATQFKWNISSDTVAQYVLAVSLHHLEPFWIGDESCICSVTCVVCWGCITYLDHESSWPLGKITYLDRNIGMGHILPTLIGVSKLQGINEKSDMTVNDFVSVYFKLDLPWHGLRHTKLTRITAWAQETWNTYTCGLCCASIKQIVVLF